jgi:hypothetical protein
MPDDFERFLDYPGRNFPLAASHLFWYAPRVCMPNSMLYYWRRSLPTLPIDQRLSLCVATETKVHACQ